MAQRNAQALGKLAEWGARFEKVATDKSRRDLTRDMSRETLNLIEEGFRRESTPYGQKWRPKKMPNGEQILVERNLMRPRFFVRVGPGHFTVYNPQPYTNTHQYGDPARNIPKRQMWPEANRLPAKYIRVYTRQFQRHMFATITGKTIKRVLGFFRR